MVDGLLHFNVDLKKLFKISGGSPLDRRSKPFSTPTVCFHGFLKDFMEYMPVDLWLTGGISGFDAILKYSSTSACK